MNLSNLTTWLDEWSQTWSLPTLPQRAHFETSSRLRTTLGRCHPVSGTIRLHPALLDEPEALLREVACHEAAHVAAYLRHGRRIRPHGREWAALMTEAGFEPRARLDPARLSEKCRQATGPRGRYQHRCPVCDVGRTARRAMRRWRCRTCVRAGRDGVLEIEEKGTDLFFPGEK